AYLNKEFGPEHRFFIQPLFKRNGMTPRQVVARALEYRDEVGGGDTEGDGRRDGQLWALFDRDQHHDIPAAMREARVGGVRVGFSHPSFDLWLLLHFTDVSEQQSGSSRIVHEKLRQHAGFETFDIHNDKSIGERRVDALRGKQGDATRRAKKLVDECPTGACSASDDHTSHCDPLRRDPSTNVWRLLVELGIVNP